MSRDALIEALAEAMFYGGMSPEDLGVEWEGLSRQTTDVYRDAAMTILPVIVAFVADWLGVEGAMIRGDDGSLLACDVWHEEMGA